MPDSPPPDYGDAIHGALKFAADHGIAGHADAYAKALAALESGEVALIRTETTAPVARADAWLAAGALLAVAEEPGSPLAELASRLLSAAEMIL